MVISAPQNLSPAYHDTPAKVVASIASDNDSRETEFSSEKRASLLYPAGYNSGEVSSIRVSEH